MSTEEFYKLIDSLPPLAPFKGVGGECYVFNTNSGMKEEVLLDTGEIIKGDARVMRGDDIKSFKRGLKVALSFDAKYLGKGVVHKL